MKMKKLSLILGAVAVTSLSGCALDDGTRTQMEGAGIGSILGAALGYAVGGEEGAVIGLAVGGGIGFAVGNNIAKRKQSYANLEDALDGEIRYFAELNQSVADQNKKIAQEIAQLDKQSKNLRRQYNDGQISRENMLAEKAAVNKRYQQNQQYIAELNKQYNDGANYLNSDLSQTGDKSKISSLKREQQRLKEEINTVNQYQKQFARIEQQMSV